MQLFGLILASITLFSIIGLSESFAEFIPNPRQQLESGINPEDIQCKENRVLVIRSNGNPACVTQKTADRTGWEIIKPSFDKIEIPTDDEKIILQNKVLENNELTFSSNPIGFEIMTIPNDEPLNISVSQIQEFKDEYVETPDFASCDNKLSTIILNSFDLSIDLHIAASWWSDSDHRDTNSGIICIIEPDRNLDLESKDSFDVTVWSTSDSNRINITVTEISESSGLFGGFVPFTNQKQSLENKLKVEKSDTVYVNYEDDTLPQPYGTNGFTDKLNITGTSSIGWNVPKYQINYNMDIIDELKKKYSVFFHGEEKTAIDYALSQKIKNEKHLIVCGDEVNSDQPYDPLDYPFDLFSRQYTVREHRPAPPQLNQELYMGENKNSRVITDIKTNYNDQNLYSLDPNSLIPTCLPIGQTIKFIVHTSTKPNLDSQRVEVMDMIIGPNTLKISEDNIVNDLYNEHGIKIKIDTLPFYLDNDYSRSKHFMSNYGPVAYSVMTTKTLTYCGFDEKNNQVCTTGFGTFNLGSSITFIADGKHISLSTYRYNLETLIDIASSMKNLNFIQTSDYLDSVKSKPELRTYGGLYGHTLSVTQKWSSSSDTENIDQLVKLPKYVPDDLELVVVYDHSKDTWQDEHNQIQTWYVTKNFNASSLVNVIENGVNIVITDSVEYDEELVSQFAKDKDMTLSEFNGHMSLIYEIDNGAYLLFYDEQSQIELYSKKYNLDELIKIGESLIGSN